MGDTLASQAASLRERRLDDAGAYAAVLSSVDYAAVGALGSLPSPQQLSITAGVILFLRARSHASALMDSNSEFRVPSGASVIK